MSQRDDEKKLDQAQNQQKRIGDAETNPETTGPAENLRERAAEMNDSDTDQENEPA